MIENSCEQQQHISLILILQGIRQYKLKCAECADQEHRCCSFKLFSFFYLNRAEKEAEKAPKRQ